MKKIFLHVVLLVTSSTSLLAQGTDPVKLDMLRAPSSPAANLLGFATTDIDRPTDISAFMLSLQSASSSFTKLPSNYAVDIAPFLISGKKNSDLTTTGLQSTGFSEVFKQTFVLSAGIRNADTSEKNFNAKNTYAGFGFKFSVLRGNYDEETQKNLNAISNLQDTMLHHLMTVAKKWRNKNDPELMLLKFQLMAMTKGVTDPAQLIQITNGAEYQEIQTKINDKLQQFTDSELKEVKQELNDRIKKIAADFQTSRIGFSWDINGGISAEFVDKKFNNSKVYNAGLWQSFGYTNKTGSSFLGLVRFLYSPDKVFAKDNSINNIGNISTLDAGVRYAFSKSQSKFSCSLEGVYRSVLSSKTIAPSWRLIFNADYTILENRKINFSFGRDFDGTISKDGNLIAALTLLTGFGNKR
ncbi:MAG TPA: hypothetical protein PKY28_07335 [Ferruginibacter sp.]|nr:hypothetical protein [Ferruginibacter sp.]